MQDLDPMWTPFLSALAGPDGEWSDKFEINVPPHLVPVDTRGTLASFAIHFMNAMHRIHERGYSITKLPNSATFQWLVQKNK